MPINYTHHPFSPLSTKVKSVILRGTIVSSHLHEHTTRIRIQMRTAQKLYLCLQGQALLVFQNHRSVAKCTKASGAGFKDRVGVRMMGQGRISMISQRIYP